MATISGKIKQKAIDAVIILCVFAGTGIYSCTTDIFPQLKKNQTTTCDSARVVTTLNM
jgi:hypothetical protein